MGVCTGPDSYPFSSRQSIENLGLDSVVGLGVELAETVVHVCVRFGVVVVVEPGVGTCSVSINRVVVRRRYETRWTERNESV